MLPLMTVPSAPYHSFLSKLPSKSPLPQALFSQRWLGARLNLQCLRLLEPDLAETLRADLTLPKGLDDTSNEKQQENVNAMHAPPLYPMT